MRGRKEVRKQHEQEEPTSGELHGWFEALQGTSLNEPEENVTRSGQSCPHSCRPQVISDFQGCHPAHSLHWEPGILPPTEISLPKANTGTHSLENGFAPLLGEWQSGRFCFNPISGIPGYFMNRGLNLKLEPFNRQGYAGHQSDWQTRVY